MAVRVAKTAGFCFGVQRVIGMALGLSRRFQEQLWTLGPLIHNRQAVGILNRRGVVILEQDQLPEGGKVLVRAHGVAPEVVEELTCKGVEICDGTCPHVRRAQRLAGEYESSGYQVVVIGDRGHAEVKGIVGHAGGKALVIEKETDLQQLQGKEKVCVVVQTTQDTERFEKLVGEIRNQVKGELKVFDTICRATAQRQHEARELAQKVDLMVVVGGHHSANTRRLAEICAETGTATIHVETAKELPEETIKNYQEVGVTAGASTPHWILRNVVEQLRALQRQRRSWVVRTGYFFLQLLIYSQLWLSLGAGGLNYVVQRFFVPTIDYGLCGLAFLYVLAMHILNRLNMVPKEVELRYGIERSIHRWRWALLVAAAAAILGCLAMSWRWRWEIRILVSFSLAAGMIYSFAIIPQGWLPGFRYRRLMDLPGSKDVFMASAWVLFVSVIPFLTLPRQVDWLAFSLVTVFIFFLVFLRSMIFDLRELEGDIILGNETLPVVLGKEGGIRVMRGAGIVCALVIIAGVLLHHLPGWSVVLLLPLVVFQLLVPREVEKEFYQSIWFDGLMDGAIILCGLGVWVVGRM